MCTYVYMYVTVYSTYNHNVTFTYRQIPKLLPCLVNAVPTNSAGGSPFSHPHQHLLLAFFTITILTM